LIFTQPPFEKLAKPIAGMGAEAPRQPIDFRQPCKPPLAKSRKRPTTGLPICMELAIVCSVVFHSSWSSVN
jgi:hypothetical protein